MIRCKDHTCKATPTYSCRCILNTPIYFCEKHIQIHLIDTKIPHKPSHFQPKLDDAVKALILSSLNSIKVDAKRKYKLVDDELSRIIILLKERAKLMTKEMNSLVELIDKAISTIKSDSAKLENNNVKRALSMNLDEAAKECSQWKIIDLEMNSQDLENYIKRWCQFECKPEILFAINQSSWENENKVGYRPPSSSHINPNQLKGEAKEDIISGPRNEKGMKWVGSHDIRTSEMSSKVSSKELIYDRTEKITSDLARNSGILKNSRESISQGLPNLSNTCFMNSILQCIAHFPSFVQFFENSHFKSAYGISLQNLILSMISNTDPENFARAFRTESIRFSGHGNGSQNDSKEFYCLLIEALLEDCPSIKETFILQKTEVYTFDECMCKNQITTDYPFIPLAVTSRNNWISEIQEFLREERKPDYYYCTRCRTKRSGYIATTFKFPKVMAIYFHQPITVELGSSVIIDNKNPTVRNSSSRSGARGSSCPPGKTKDNEGGKFAGQKVEYIPESCVLRSATNAQYGHYWTVALEGNKLFEYNDLRVSSCSQRSHSAYMVFLVKRN